ncbi:hypothetical protein TIFTF001_056070 [Ficus carica]|uniref:Uncharacterized protein n=1 Tax=Ficus carica TaxID=3494 RepID=A0AA88EEB9_FICCA|nr:hypothetical protein TIFTF001_056070 [Ficus carica]
MTKPSPSEAATPGYGSPTHKPNYPQPSLPPPVMAKPSPLEAHDPMRRITHPRAQLFHTTTYDRPSDAPDDEKPLPWPPMRSSPPPQTFHR